MALSQGDWDRAQSGASIRATHSIRSCYWTRGGNICVRLVKSRCQIAATGSLSNQRAVALLKARFAEVDGCERCGT